LKNIPILISLNLTNSMTDEQMQYPIGNFVPPVSYTDTDLHKWVNEIKVAPGQYRQAVISLTEPQLDTNYRKGGWTLRQVVHHVADSHLNSITRFKLALTEENPIIKPYEEAHWALLADYRMPVEPSLRMLEGIHSRWVSMMESFTDREWNKTFVHPESKRTLTLKHCAALYAWHGKHHLAHITETVKKFG
jgi:hypothetical protein